MIVITLFSLFSFPDDISHGITIPHFDKIVHFTFHCVLVVLAVCAAQERKKDVFNLKGALVAFFLLSVIYGLLIEVLQYYMPYGRAAEIYDVLANISGALLGVLLIKKYISLITKLK